MSNSELTLELRHFVQNAGMVGFIRLLEQQGAKAGVDYRIEADTLILSTDYLLSLDLAMAYCETAIALFEEELHYAYVMRAIVQAKQELEKDPESRDEERLARAYSGCLFTGKNLEKALNYLQDTTGLDLATTHIALEKEKDAQAKAELLHHYESLLANETIKFHLQLTSVAIKVLSHSWDGLAFIYRPQGKLSIKSNEDMVALLRKDVTDKLHDFLLGHPVQSKHQKTCCECGCTTSTTFELSLLVDMMDDVRAKASAFWNFDQSLAMLCPACAFTALLMPFAFEKVGPDFLFINANATIPFLNAMNPRINYQSVLKETQPIKFHNQILKRVLEVKEHQLYHLQVIRQTPSGYRFEVLSQESLLLMRGAGKELSALARLRSITDPVELNIYEATLNNILAQRHHYLLLHRLSRLVLESPELWWAYRMVYAIQLKKQRFNLEQYPQMEGCLMMSAKELYYLTNSAEKEGANLKNRLQASDKNAQGLIYRLLNQVHAGDKHEFLNTVIRMHNSYSIALSADFIRMIHHDHYFKDMAYGYLIGLQTKSSTESEELTHD